jgi:cytochrome c oxidase subunit 2
MSEKDVIRETRPRMESAIDDVRITNEIHCVKDQKVLIHLRTQDVIHSFFVPDFRTKQDAIPGRYTYLWFQATKPGRFRLYCAEYCGTDHSKMIGWVVASRRSPVP